MRLVKYPPPPPGGNPSMAHMGMCPWTGYGESFLIINRMKFVYTQSIHNLRVWPNCSIAIANKWLNTR